MHTLLLLTAMAAAAPTGPAHADSHRRLASPELPALRREDADRQSRGLAPRFAVPHTVSDSPANSGTWERLDQSSWRWELVVSSPGATSLNLGFGRFQLPDGAVMTVQSMDGGARLRPVTSVDNNPGNQYWSPVVRSSEVIVRIDMATELRPHVETQVELTQVGVGYRGFGANEPIERSGGCNFDVGCPQTAGWEKEIPCVAVISTGGSNFCTGFMVNNIKNDKAPLFMTAHHCGITAQNAASLVAYWHYQDPAEGQQDCPGNSIDSGPNPETYSTGATFLAGDSSSDYTLVKLNQPPPEEWGVSHCGWSAEDVASQWSVGIHHPSCDFKRWSIDNDPSEIGGYGGPGTMGTTHLRVNDWDLGTTEPGSSGSPLFNQDHRVVGQLHGGAAACGNDAYDVYGRLAHSWNLGLKEHLDPEMTGRLTVDTLVSGSPTEPPTGPPTELPTGPPTELPTEPPSGGVTRKYAKGQFANQFDAQPDKAARCRCASEDASLGLSVCMTGCGDPDQVCDSSFGCGSSELGCDSAQCTCQPDSNLGAANNKMSFDDCFSQCAAIGMRIAGSEAQFQASMGTGCGTNGRDQWIDLDSNLPPTEAPTEPPTEPPSEPPTDQPTEPPAMVARVAELMEQMTAEWARFSQATEGQLEGAHPHTKAKVQKKVQQLNNKFRKWRAVVQL